MDSIDERVIKISRSSSALITALGCAFVAGGYWMYQVDAFQLSKMRHHNNLFTTHATGILVIAVGIALAVISIKAIFENKPSLILNSKGILKNPNLSAAQLIPWNDIVSFGIVEYRSDTRLVVILKDPQKYYGVSGGVGRNINAAEAKRFGSPITISTSFLDIDAEELETVCNSYLAKYLDSRSQFS